MRLSVHAAKYVLLNRRHCFKLGQLLDQSFHTKSVFPYKYDRQRALQALRQVRQRRWPMLRGWSDQKE